MQTGGGGVQVADEGELFVLERRLVTDDFLSPCWTSDAEARMAAAEEIVQQIQEYFRQPESAEGQQEGAITSEQIVYHLEGILRHAVACPYADLRDKFGELLVWVRDHGHTIPRPLHNSPSWFIAASNCVKFNDPDNEDGQKALELSFAAKGRISNLYMLMCLFPVFAEKYEAVYRCVIEGSGPLPMFWRNYIAIMGASRHHCRYMIVQQEVQFYANGGDLNWLRGLSYAPPKLQKLATLNALLAHQPWLITPSHLENLISGNDNDNWSIPELLQAVIILIMFHSLAGLSWGLGVVPEIDREGGVLGRANEGPLFSPSSPLELATNEALQGATKDALQKNSELIEKLNRIKLAKEEGGESDSGEAMSSSLKSDQPSFSSSTTKNELHQRQLFEDITDPDPASPAVHSNLRRLVNYSKYWGDVDMKHQDFDVRSSAYKLFRLQDYTWEEHGFSLINRYYPNIAELLDAVFTEAFTMTEYSLFDSTNVDTAPFREAIWYYVLRLKGMMHDDYNYQDVNSLLDRQIKTFLKQASCTPESISQKEFAFFGVKLLDREKVHVNLLVMEARQQAEILYLLSNLMKLKGE